MIEFPIQHKLFTTTSEVLDSIVEDIRKAEKTIDLEQFYFTADEATKKISDALIERSKNGVKVRCHLDSAGAFYFSKSKMFQEMVTAGIEVKFFNWLIPFTRGFQKFGFFRNHRRLLLIDFDTPKCVGYNGGFCMGETPRKWLDIAVRLSLGEHNGAEPTPLHQLAHPFASMNKSFENMWKRSESKNGSWTNIDVSDFREVFKKYLADQKQESEDKKMLDSIFRLPFLYATQAPLPGKHHLHRALLSRISKATKHITITTPYFLPTHRIMRKLVSARKRGVQVTIIIPQKTDHGFLDIGIRTYMNYFLDNKIDIYRHPKMIHGKAIEIDNQWAMVGTMNMDTISLRYNFESGVVSGEGSFVADVEKALNNLRDEAKLLTAKDWNKRSLSERIAEVIIWPFRKLM